MESDSIGRFEYRCDMKLVDRLIKRVKVELGLRIEWFDKIAFSAFKGYLNDIINRNVTRYLLLSLYVLSFLKLYHHSSLLYFFGTLVADSF